MSHKHRLTLGDFNCLAINDGGMTGKARYLFTNAPEEPLQQALQRHGLQADHLPSAWTCLLVETPDQLVLIDTGENNAGNWGGGRLLPTLAAEGIVPEDIDTVILTHGHGDHIGGCTDAEGRPNFPNARYVMWQTEWAHWTDEANLASMPERIARLVRHCLLPISGQMELIDAYIEIAPGIRAIAAPGHTVGHMVVEITSAGERLLNLADAALHPIHLEHPGWVAAFDTLPDQTAATRRALCQRAAATGALVLAFHFAPFPGLGRILQAGDAYHWQPI